VLYRVVREHKATLFAQAEARSASGRGYPRHVRDEFDNYERCGILAYGVVRARCQTCGDEQVVAFSCKRKTLCCSCAGRRMAEVTTHLVEDVGGSLRFVDWNSYSAFRGLEQLLLNDNRAVQWLLCVESHKVVVAR